VSLLVNWHVYTLAEILVADSAAPEVGIAHDAAMYTTQRPPLPH
jgi:hypothetical protein